MMPRLRYTRREWALIGVLLIVIAGAGALAKSGANQWVNMWVASRHARVLNQQLSAYPEFHNVRCYTMTSHDGAMSVYGYGANYEQRRRLRNLVSKSNPPTDWLFWVKVKPDAPR